MKELRFWFVFFILAIGFICRPVSTLAASSDSDSVAAFYKEKPVVFVVPTPPGGGYDTVARMLQPYLSKHLGTTVIIKNEPGASGKVMMNRLTKESDGRTIFTGTIQALVMAQLFNMPGTQYNLTDFNWLGTVTESEFVVSMGKKSGYKTIDDLQKAEVVKFGADGRAGGFASRPLWVGYVLGVNVKVVTGYKGTSGVLMSVLNGETDGISGSLQGPMLSYIKSGDLFPILVTSHERFELLPDTPTIYEVKKLSPKEKRIADIAIASEFGRPVATTPGVPKERIAFLQSALMKALEEPALKEKFETFGTPLKFVSGEAVLGSIKEILSLEGEEKALIGGFIGAKGY